MEGERFGSPAIIRRGMASLFCSMEAERPGSSTLLKVEAAYPELTIATTWGGIYILLN